MEVEDDSKDSEGAFMSFIENVGTHIFDEFYFYKFRIFYIERVQGQSEFLDGIKDAIVQASNDICELGVTNEFVEKAYDEIRALFAVVWQPADEDPEVTAFLLFDVKDDGSGYVSAVCSKKLTNEMGKVPFEFGNLLMCLAHKFAIEKRIQPMYLDASNESLVTYYERLGYSIGLGCDAEPTKYTDALHKAKDEGRDFDFAPVMTENGYHMQMCTIDSGNCVRALTQIRMALQLVDKAENMKRPPLVQPRPRKVMPVGSWKNDPSFVFVDKFLGQEQYIEDWFPTNVIVPFLMWLADTQKLQVCLESNVRGIVDCNLDERPVLDSRITQLVLKCKKAGPVISFILLRVVRLSGNAHASALIVDHQMRTIEVYDPNGSEDFDKESSSCLRDYLYQVSKIADPLKPYTVLAVQETCPYLGPHATHVDATSMVVGEHWGWCAAWTAFYLVVRCLNPNFSRTDINEYVDTLAKTYYVPERFAAWIIKIAESGELQKFGLKMSSVFPMRDILPPGYNTLKSYAGDIKIRRGKDETNAPEVKVEQDHNTGETIYSSDDERYVITKVGKMPYTPLPPGWRTTNRDAKEGEDIFYNASDQLTHYDVFVNPKGEATTERPKVSILQQKGIYSVWFDEDNDVKFFVDPESGISKVYGKFLGTYGGW
jgi:hypothetical protein